MSLFVGAILMEDSNRLGETTVEESEIESERATCHQKPSSLEWENMTSEIIGESSMKAVDKASQEEEEAEEVTSSGSLMSSEAASVDTLNEGRDPHDEVKSSAVVDDEVVVDGLSRSEALNSIGSQIHDEMDSKKGFSWFRRKGKEKRKEDSTAAGKPSSERRLMSFGRRKSPGSGKDGAASTTGLILENRPANLPAKSAIEEKRHRLEYEKMLSLAKKKEKQLLKEKKKKEAEKEKKEKDVSSSISAWKTDTVPNWDSVCGSKAVQEMWWHGIPPSVRGAVWPKAIGNSLHITEDLYKIFLARANEKLAIAKSKNPQKEIDPHLVGKDHEKSVEVIQLDVSRTFPRLCMFQKGGPLYNDLHDVLGAYACYRPDVGYVQGMSFLAAVLLLYVSTSEAFICLAGILNRPCHLAFFRIDEKEMKAYFDLFTVFFEELLPKLSSHFNTMNVTPDMFLIDWIYSLYSKALPLDVACRVWDVYFRDGDVFLFRTALGILSMYQGEMLEKEFIELGRFFTRLPGLMSADKLFEHIMRINISSKRFNQVLAQQLSLMQT
eukprot:m.47423 g.47423  ORF g.47423 m.47423 type:complete len:552 (+) comp33784_c0_seq4:415-2070(+)